MAYNPYEVAYTPLLPQHIMMGSPHPRSQYRASFQPHEHSQYTQGFGYDYADPSSATTTIAHSGTNQGITANSSDDHLAHHSQFEAQSLPSHLNGLGLTSLRANGTAEYYLDQQYSTPTKFKQDRGSQSIAVTPQSYKYIQQTPIAAASPAHAAVAGSIANHIDFNSAPSRTVYLGNVPGDITPKELLDHVRSGIIESVRLLSDKMCAFISFLDESSALLFHSDAILKRLTIRENDIKIGWGRNYPLTPIVLGAIQRDGATRNVYIGNLPKDITADQLQDDLEEFGLIDTIKILPEKGVAFIHFCSIASAIKVVTNLASKYEFYQDRKIFYGKDRCAFITKTQQHNAAQYLGLAPGMEHLVTNADREFISTALLQQSAAAAAVATTAGGANNLGNRTVYLGNLPKEVKIEDICNVVRGGLLQNIKHLQDRRVCFITFIDPIAAAQFFAMSQLHGLTLHSRRIKIGWGKHSGPLSNALTLAVSSGASRNIYIGNIDLDHPKYSQDALREKFSEFGEIEQINYLYPKRCVFINFTNIGNAILAIDKIKIDEDFSSLKINFGKDRCGNIPRQFMSKN